MRSYKSTLNLFVWIIILNVITVPAQWKKPSSFGVYKRAMQELWGGFEFLDQLSESELEAAAYDQFGRADFEEAYKLVKQDYMIISVGSSSTQGFVVIGEKPVEALTIPNSIHFGATSDNSQTDVTEMVKFLFRTRDDEFKLKAISVPIILSNSISFAVNDFIDDGILKQEKTDKKFMQIGGEGGVEIKTPPKAKTAAYLVYQMLYAIQEINKEVHNCMAIPIFSNLIDSHSTTHFNKEDRHPYLKLFIKPQKSKPKVDNKWMKELAKTQSKKSGRIKLVGDCGGGLSRAIMKWDGAFIESKTKAGGGKDFGESVNTLYHETAENPFKIRKLAEKITKQFAKALEPSGKPPIDAMTVFMYQTGQMREDYYSAHSTYTHAHLDYYDEYYDDDEDDEDDEYDDNEYYNDEYDGNEYSDINELGSLQNEINELKRLIKIETKVGRKKHYQF